MKLNVVLIAMSLWMSCATAQVQELVQVGHIGGTRQAVAVSGNFAFVGDGTQLQVLDVTDPADPIQIGALLLNKIVFDVFVEGSIAYVVAQSFELFATDAGLHVIDVSDPTAPVEVGFRGTGTALGVSVSGNFAYVAEPNNGLRVIDVSDPAAPVLVGSVTPAPANTQDVFVLGNIAYVAGGSGLHVIDVSDPAAPVEVGLLATGVSAHGVFVSGNVAYLADADALRVIDVSDPTTPVQVAFFNSPGIVQDAFVTNLGYVTDNLGGFAILAIPPPAPQVDALPRFIDADRDGG